VREKGKYWPSCHIFPVSHFLSHPWPVAGCDGKDRKKKKERKLIIKNTIFFLTFSFLILSLSSRLAGKRKGNRQGESD